MITCNQNTKQSYVALSNSTMSSLITVFRAKFKKNGRGLSLEFRKGRLYKPRSRRRRSKEYHTIVLDQNDQCCTSKLEPRTPYIVMGVKRGGENVATFVMAWNGRDRVCTYNKYYPVTMYNWKAWQKEFFLIV